MCLYERYRPQALADIIGQPDVTRPLAVASPKLACFFCLNQRLVEVEELSDQQIGAELAEWEAPPENEKQ